MNFSFAHWNKRQKTRAARTRRRSRRQAFEQTARLGTERSMQLESLEERRMLTGNFDDGDSTDTIDVALVGNSIDAAGGQNDGAADTFEVSLAAPDLLVKVNGGAVVEQPLSSVTDLTINGSSDDDTLTLDANGADVVLEADIIRVGGLTISHTDIETINLVGAGHVTQEGTASPDELVLTGSGLNGFGASFFIDDGLNGANDGAPQINLDAQSFEFDGGDGGDSLVISDAAGLPEFAGTAARAHASAAFLEGTGRTLSEVSIHFEAGRGAGSGRPIVVAATHCRFRPAAGDRKAVPARQSREF